MTGIDIRYRTRDHETFDGYLTVPAGHAKASRDRVLRCFKSM